jgi:hypothetical protein
MKVVCEGGRWMELDEVRFEILTTVKMSVLVLFVITPCGLVGR